MKNHSSLKKVSEEAWKVVVSTFNSETEKVTTETFSQLLLREIIQLTPSQQLQLVTDLAKDHPVYDRIVSLVEEVDEKLEPLDEHGINQYGLDNIEKVKSSKAGGNSKDYRIAKLKRDFGEEAVSLLRTASKMFGRQVSSLRQF